LVKKKVSRTTAKKMKDKWRAKQWYKIYAPDMFDGKEIPETPADDPSKLLGRVVEVTMQELTSDFSKSNIKLKFKVTRIAGLEAHTIFVGHDLTSDYIRRLTRRRRTKIDGVYDVTTKDGYRVRVKPMAIAEHRIQSSQKSTIRNIMKDVLLKEASKQLLGEFVKNIISGEMSREIFKACKPIYTLKRIEMRRSEILGQLSSHKAVEKEAADIDKLPETGGEIAAEGESTEESEEVEEESGETVEEQEPEEEDEKSPEEIEPEPEEIKNEGRSEPESVLEPVPESVPELEEPLIEEKQTDEENQDKEE